MPYGHLRTSQIGVRMMASRVIDPQTLYWNVVNVLEKGLRTSTYKLATMTALIDFSAKHQPSIAVKELEVPLPELARSVMALYWDQFRPFDGIELRQSTQPRSRIFDAVESLRSAANSTDDDLTIQAAERLVPGNFRRAIDTVGLCLAQQPLPRLQRTAASARSIPFLYDDSFLHDNVTRNELERHGNAIQLKPGVAQALAIYERQLRRILQGMWVEDVLRMNQLTSNERTRVEGHLFGLARGRVTRTLEATPSEDDLLPAGPGATGSESNFASATFATRLNTLIAARPSYSSGEVAAEIRRSGFPMTVTTLTQLQAGVGPSPSDLTITALAKHFDVRPEYFFDPGMTAEPGTRAEEETRANAAGRPESGEPASNSKTSPVSAQVARNSPADDDTRNVFSDDLDAIAGACEIQVGDCWIRPSNTPVSCRPRGDTRKPVGLPKIGLHTWAWMIAHGYSDVAPNNLLHVRRRCGTWTCCNPQHLYATSSDGSPLSKTAIDGLLRRSSPPPKEPAEPNTQERQDPLVLPAHLDSIRNRCTLERSGCWIAPNAGPLACRADGDFRADSDLQMMAPHRWVWMVVHGRSSNPLPAEFHVRRRCENDRCCRPDHLRLTTPHGEELTLKQAEAILKSRESQGTRSFPDTGNSNGAALFAERLNRLFEANRNAAGKPYTAGEVAAELQADSLAVSKALIERLRSGVGDTPSVQIVEALAYFFDVDPEYFSAGAHSVVVSNAIASDVGVRSGTDFGVRIPAPQVEAIDISANELGRIVTGLSETISECLTRDPAQTQSAKRLLLLLADVGALLSAPEGDLAIGRQLLQQILGEWDAIARDAEHHLVIARLARLANGA